MLGDIIIAKSNAYIAFVGKRVIEQTLNMTVPEGSQMAEYLFHKGQFDLIVPCNISVPRFLFFKSKFNQIFIFWSKCKTHLLIFTFCYKFDFCHFSFF